MIPQVKFNILNGGLGRLALPKDSNSGLIVYNDNISDLTTFSSSSRVHKFSSLKQVEATGITSDSTNFKAEHYILDEYFRQGGGAIWISINAVPVSYDWAEFTELKNISAGEIRQYGMYCTKALNTSDVAAINTIIKGFDTFKKPAIAILAFDTTTITFANLPDLRAQATTLPYVSVVIGQDTENYPLTYFDATDKALPNLGAILGAVSRSNVSTNVLYVGQYNYTDGVQMVTPGFVVKTGTFYELVPVNSTLVDEELLDDLNDKGYIFWRYLPNVNGTYLSNDNNCSLSTDDYNSIHLMRVIQKCIREVDAKVSLLLGSPVKLTAGKMSAGAISTFTSYVSSALNAMVNANEISNFNVFIDPDQNVGSTNTVEIEIGILPIVSSDYIEVSIGYTL